MNTNLKKKNTDQLSNGGEAMHTVYCLPARMLKSIMLIFSLLFSVAVNAQQSKVVRINNPLPKDLEIEVALSALPPNLRGGATVYVLNPDKGFVVARTGNNGFHAFVARTGDDAMRGTWVFKKYRDDILYPISFDSVGAKSQMRVFFDIAALQAKGTPPEELKKLIQNRYKTKYYKAPEKPGVSYMLSPILRTYTSPEANDDVTTINFPHIMYYAPNVTNKEIGAEGPKPAEFQYLLKHGKWKNSPYPFIIMQGPHGYMIQPRGDAERAVITNEFKPMLAKLAKINKNWVLPDSQHMDMSHHHNM